MLYLTILQLAETSKVVINRESKPTIRTSLNRTTSSQENNIQT